MKVLAKIMLGIALFATVVAVSYLKTDLQGKSIDDKIDTRLNPVAVSMADDANPAEEQTSAVEEQTDSQDSSEPEESSVNVADAEQEGASSEIEEAIPAVATPQPSEKPAPSKVSEPPKDPAKEIIDYFQKRLDDLPEDLTSYEKKVAIKEIRDDVCERFKITRAKLNSLSQEYKIRIP